MSVATKNPFALLDDDGSSPAPAAPATKAPTPAAPAAPTRGTANRARGGPASRGGKYPPRGGAKTSTNDGAGNLNQNGINEPSTEGRKFEGRGRGRGGDRGARGGGARGRGGRNYDKHSQTGKVDSDKKIHQTWGGDEGTTELKAEEGAIKDATAETADEWGTSTPAADEWGTTAPATEGATNEGGDKGSKPRRERGERGDREREPREPEVEDNTLTLEQYLAEKKAKEDGIVPKLDGFRAANDGADDLWKDAVALEKADDEAYFAAKAKSTPKQRAKKEEKVFIEIEGRFERPNTGGARGGRGGDRGGRGRGGDRGGRGRGGDRGGDRGRGARGGRPNAGPTVSVDDETAFPSLS